MTDLDSILESIETVRRRWRLRTGLEAFATLVAIGIGFLVVWAAIWAGAGASESLAIGGRIAAVATLLAAGGWLGWRWRRRRPDNAQIALYVEEQIPSLGQSLVSAVHSLAAPPPVPGLTERVLRAARQGLDAVDRGRHLESRALQRASRWLSGLALGTVGLLLVGPRPIRDAAVTLGTPWRKVPVAPTFMVAVIPGNADVPRGGAAEIKATLGGFTADNTELVVRRDTTADWERIPMSRDTAV